MPNGWKTFMNPSHVEEWLLLHAQSTRKSVFPEELKICWTSFYFTQWSWNPASLDWALFQGRKLPTNTREKRRGFLFVWLVFVCNFKTNRKVYREAHCDVGMVFLWDAKYGTSISLHIYSFEDLKRNFCYFTYNFALLHSTSSHQQFFTLF